MFSMDAYKIEIAIKGSIMFGLGIIYPKVAKVIVKLWAIVKTEHWMSNVLIELPNKISERIKRMWSKPNGITWVKPRLM